MHKHITEFQLPSEIHQYTFSTMTPSMAQCPISHTFRQVLSRHIYKPTKSQLGNHTTANKWTVKNLPMLVMHCKAHFSGEMWTKKSLRERLHCIVWILSIRSDTMHINALVWMIFQYQLHESSQTKLLYCINTVTKQLEHHEHDKRTEMVKFEMVDDFK